MRPISVMLHYKISHCYIKFQKGPGKNHVRPSRQQKPLVAGSLQFAPFQGAHLKDGNEVQQHYGSVACARTLIKTTYHQCRGGPRQGHLGSMLASSFYKWVYSVERLYLLCLALTFSASSYL
jgi:hypothetical protein